MNQSPISQRLKILIEKLGLDTRSFSQALEVSEGTTRNYFNRGSKPNAEYLEKISNSFESANLHWLLTGKGDPFILPTNENAQATSLTQKNFRTQVVGTNHGKAHQEQNTNSDSEATKTELALAQKEIEHLRAQLTMKDAVIASKDETITLLRISYNRPN